MKQTAVEWLINEIIAKDWWYLPESMKQDIIEQSKTMEKEQIKDAWNTRAKIDGVLTFTDNRTAEEYYNETFKSE